jgi:Nucleotide modification associated domain 3
MRVCISRKGFDSAAGKVPSPIVGGQPISLPIPFPDRSESTYESIGLADHVVRATKGRLAIETLCHEDPMFHEGRCAFGQTGPAQSHLHKRGMDIGDVFLFFGLFAQENGQDRHHRIFGYLEIEEVRQLGSHPREEDSPKGFPRRHPHTIGRWNSNNTLYLGRGAKAKQARDSLRLSATGGLISRWRVPPWLHEIGLSYHSDPGRWISDIELKTVGRGQEFVADIGELAERREWLASLIDAINS